LKEHDSVWYKLFKKIRKVKNNMFQNIKKFIIVGVTGLTMAVPSLVPALAGSVSADTLNQSAGTNISQGLCQGINSATTTDATPSNAGCDTSSGSTNLTSIAREVINIFSIIVGIVAVIMIIVGGFRYVTSGGASDKVGGAKNTLIYAIIGLIIVALAQAIVHFVLNQATTSISG
jgi:hypothetical protein